MSASQSSHSDEHHKSPSPHAVFYALCAQKAGWVAHQSVDGARSTRFAMFFLTLAFAVLSGLITYATMSAPDKRRFPYQQRVAPTVAVSSILTAAAALCMCTYVQAVEHKFYCQEEPEWHEWTRDWVTAGFVPGLLTLLIFADWFSLVLFDMTDRLNLQFNKKIRAGSLLVLKSGLAAACFIIVFPACAIYGIACVIYGAIMMVLTRSPTAFFNALPDPWRHKVAATDEVELGNRPTAEHRDATNDQPSNDEPPNISLTFEAAPEVPPPYPADQEGTGDLGEAVLGSDIEASTGRLPQPPPYAP